jgi:hypothetical protein
VSRTSACPHHYANIIVRYQLATEIAGAKAGKALVSDNIQQRTKVLITKLAAHAEARAFYMPTFTAPPRTSKLNVDKTPLHLPSSLSSDERARFCRTGLAKAEQVIRLAALGDALADLTRHLRTRTFLLRFKAKQATGNCQNTRLRDSVSGVSRRVDAAAAGYRRHRIAYKALVGAGDWEKTYQPLTTQDVRGLSEKGVTNQELQERYHCKKLAKALASVLASLGSGSRATSKRLDHALQEDDEDEEDEEEEAEMARIDEADAARKITGPAGLGEGRRKLSWIWLTGLQVEDVVDDQLTNSEFCSCSACTIGSRGGRSSCRVEPFQSSSRPVV